MTLLQDLERQNPCIRPRLWSLLPIFLGRRIQTGISSLQPTIRGGSRYSDKTVRIRNGAVNRGRRTRHFPGRYWVARIRLATALLPPSERNPRHLLNGLSPGVIPSSVLRSLVSTIRVTLVVCGPEARLLGKPWRICRATRALSLPLLQWFLSPHLHQRIRRHLLHQNLQWTVRRRPRWMQHEVSIPRRPTLPRRSIRSDLQRVLLS